MGTEEDKEQARQKMFDSMDLKGTGVITFDEWLKFCLEHIAAKTATMDPHPILDHGNMEQFTEHDVAKEGIVMKGDFPSLMDKVLETPKKLDIAHPDKAVLFMDDVEKRREHQLEIFEKNNPRGDDRMCVDEWIGLAMDLFKKMI